jgi:hypothetical protein
MSQPVSTKLDFGNARRIINLAPGAATGEPVTYEQLNAALEAIAWKDNVRVACATNITVSSPGASLDGVTMASGDRVLLKAQTTQTENGIYIWNGSATPLTRAADASTFDELESAVVTADEGTSAGSTFRQTQVNGVLGTNNVVWTSFGTAAAAANSSTAGIIRIATQTEVDTGTDDTTAVTPLKLKTASFLVRKYSTTIGDGSATSIAVTHNLNTLNVQVYAYEAGGSKRMVLVEIQHTSVNQVTLIFDSAPTSNAISVVVLG